MAKSQQDSETQPAAEEGAGEEEAPGAEAEIERAKRRFRRGSGFTTTDRMKGKPWNRDEWRVFQSVFGKQTLMALYKLSNDGIFSELYGEFNSGKEANIFVGTDSAGRFVAVKIYRIEASDFTNMLPYLRGDPRFDNVGPSKREVVFAWTRKEFSNLSKLEAAGVRVPHPIAFRENVLVFELVLDGESIAPQLKKAHTEVGAPDAFFRKVVENMRKIHRAGFVHSDLSEYNILVSSGSEPVIIDCAQAVLLVHPQSQEFLKRDCENIAKFFSKRMGVKTAPADILKRVVG